MSIDKRVAAINGTRPRKESGYSRLKRRLEEREKQWSELCLSLLRERGVPSLFGGLFGPNAATVASEEYLNAIRNAHCEVSAWTEEPIQ